VSVRKLFQKIRDFRFAAEAPLRPLRGHLPRTRGRWPEGPEGVFAANRQSMILLEYSPDGL
jgi:hypothetical protein